MPLVTRQAISGFFYRQSAEPVTPNTGDIWVDTDNGVVSTFDGSYLYYDDVDGSVKTLLNSFPEPGKTGFQGVYP